MKVESPHLENKEKKYPYSAIVVMPYASAPEDMTGVRSDRDFGMSFETKMVTIAALEAYTKGKAGKIVLPGEDTYGSEKTETTDQFMKEYLLDNGIPEEDIITYPSLNNSVQQLKKIKNESGQNDTYLVVSLDFHKPRVEMVANRKKMKGEHISAEGLLNERSLHYKNLIEAWKGSEGIKKNMPLEKVLRAITFVDFTGGIQNLVTKLQGPRPPLTIKN